MRRNLCEWLRALAVPERLAQFLDRRETSKYQTSENLFAQDCNLIATTSALLYPVFKGPDRRNRRKNFSGVPDLVKIPPFRGMIEQLLAPRLEYANEALIIPLGRSAESAVEYLCTKSRISRDRVLFGMPHPSPANGHRHTQFEDGKSVMCDRLDAFFGPVFRLP
jgi:hypothetical protein